MRNLINSALALFGAAAVTSASDVHDLKMDTFEPFVNKHDLVLAEFFAPWCGHCKALAPEYEEAASTLKEKEIPLVKVDCTEEAELCQQYGVEGYPTIKIFRGADNHTPYTGQRKAPAIISYMVKQSLPAVSILDGSSLAEFKTAEKVVVVAYLSADDKSSNETFTGLANGLREKLLFGATHDKALAAAEGVKQPAIVLYKQFDEGKDTFQETFDKEKLEQFIKTSSMPLIGEVGPETYADYMAAGLPLAYIFAETAEERTELSDTLRPVAQKHKGAINFATIDAKAFGAHAANLNLEADKFPAFAIQETVKNQKFPFDQSKKMTVKEIGAFVQDVLDAKIEPSVKSDPLPESQDGPVHVVVAHNYKEIVMDDDKDVLLEFYAPWCGHCKALAPKYEELAAMYFNDPARSKKVTIAKVDATTNDVPDEIAGFPTIKLYPAGAKHEPIEYQGARTVADLITFIKEKGTHKVEVGLEDGDEAQDVLADADADATMGHAAPAASKKAEAVKDKTKQKAAAAKDTVKEKAAKAKDGAKAATDKVKAKAASGTDKVADATESVKAKAASGTATAKAAAGKAQDEAASAKDGVKDQIKSKISQAAEAVKGAIVEDDDLEHDEL
ncbi:MAG: protein disulfide-isomerase precursor [Phylliscum demangeonii]|nr:MAG: protein disulfide-isomerase precursor [Phylliscum demangeonii]